MGGFAAERDAMRVRVNAVRARLAAIPLQRLDLSRLSRQRGMFALLPVSVEEIALPKRSRKSIARALIRRGAGPGHPGRWCAVHSDLVAGADRL